MSSEIENEIKQSLINDKLINFYKKFKIYIFLLLTLILLIPIIYNLKVFINKKKNEKYFEEFSLVINQFKNKKISNSETILKQLVFSDNDVISSLSLSYLFELNEIPNDELIQIINNIIEKKKSSIMYTELLKIRKSILIFDKASELEMLNLINIKDINLPYREVKLKIMLDFYKKINNDVKAKEIQSLFNEK